MLPHTVDGFVEKPCGMREIVQSGLASFCAGKLPSFDPGRMRWRSTPPVLIADLDMRIQVDLDRPDRQCQPYRRVFRAWHPLGHRPGTNWNPTPQSKSTMSIDKGPRKTLSRLLHGQLVSQSLREPIRHHQPTCRSCAIWGEGLCGLSWSVAQASLWL